MTCSICKHYDECAPQVAAGGPAMCEKMLPGEDVGQPRLFFTPTRRSQRGEGFKTKPWSERRNELMQLICRVTWSGSSITIKQIQRETGGSYYSVQSWLGKLLAEGAVKIVEKGGGRGGSVSRYRLAQP